MDEQNRRKKIWWFLPTKGRWFFFMDSFKKKRLLVRERFETNGFMCKNPHPNKRKSWLYWLHNEGKTQIMGGLYVVKPCYSFLGTDLNRMMNTQDIPFFFFFAPSSPSLSLFFYYARIILKCIAVLNYLRNENWFDCFFSLSFTACLKCLTLVRIILISSTATATNTNNNKIPKWNSGTSVKPLESKM